MMIMIVWEVNKDFWAGTILYEYIIVYISLIIPPFDYIMPLYNRSV